jgi:hypothetical protein
MNGIAPNVTVFGTYVGPNKLINQYLLKILLKNDANNIPKETKNMSRVS